MYFKFNNITGFTNITSLIEIQCLLAGLTGSAI